MRKIEKNLMIVGNWKMNKTSKEAEEWFNEVAVGVKKSKCEIIICVPFINIPSAINLTRGSQIYIGAQDCHFESFGPFTGEISPVMLQEIGVRYVILGHSERRTYFFETDELINKKVKSALKSGLKVILCVGETLQERRFNVTREKISMQIKKALYEVDEKNLEDIIFAYEPVWAIGTGKSASKEDVASGCSIIRQTLMYIYGVDVSSNFRILYGGSINAQNATELFSVENIGGGLVGGASLNAKEFLKIIECSNN